MKKNNLPLNAFFKTVLNLCNIIIPIIVGPYVLRVINREYYDLFNRLNANFSVFLALGTFGIYTYAVRELSKIRENKAECDKLFSELFILGIISNLLVSVIYFVATFFSSKEEMEVLICYILIIQLFGNIFNVEWLNEANENYFFIAVKSVLVRVLYLVSVFVFIKEADDIIVYALLLMLSSFVNTFASYFYIRRRYNLVIKGINIFKHVVPLVINLFITNIALLYAQLDKIMLGQFVSDKSVTSYTLAQYISSLIYSLLIPIVIVSVPRLANTFTKDKEECFNLHKNALNFFSLLAIPALVGVCLMSREIMILYGGENYLDCALPLSIYAFVQLISSVCYVYGDALLYVTGKEKRLLFNALIGGATNLLLNLILVLFKCYNEVTSAITILVAYALVGVLNCTSAKKQLGYNKKLFNKHTVKYLLCSVLFVPIVYALKALSINFYIRIIVTVVSCAVVYFICLLITKDFYLFKLMKKLKLIKDKQAVESEEVM